MMRRCGEGDEGLKFDDVGCLSRTSASYDHVEIVANPF